MTISEVFEHFTWFLNLITIFVMKSNLLIQLLKLVIYSEQNFMSYRQVNSHPKKIQSKNVAKKFSEY